MKTVISTYLSGIRLLFFRWKAWGVVFLCNLIFALLIARPFGALLDSLGPHRETALKGLMSFDSDFIVDLGNNFGSEIGMMLSQASIFAGLYLLLNIFLSGGIIESYVHLFEPFKFSKFWANCSKHFWRMLRLALYFITTQIVVAVVLFMIYSNLGLSPFELESEGILIRKTQIMGAIFVILIAWVDMVNEYAKIQVVIQSDRKWILPILIDTKFFCLKNFFSILCLFLLCTATFLGLLGVYAMLNNIFTMESMSSIVIALLVGQVYILFRVGVRLLFTSTAIDYLRIKGWGADTKASNLF